MERYTYEQRVSIVKTYYQNQCSISVTRRKLREILSRNHVPAVCTIQRLVAVFEETGSVVNRSRPPAPRSARSLENIAAVRESVAEMPGTSIRHRSQELGLSRSSLHTILRKDLHLHPYKIQLTQALQPADHERRRNYSNWMLEAIENDPEFWKKIIMSDEAHFHLGGFVNNQNSRIWGSENPREVHEKPLHPRRVTVWCAMWAGGVIGPYFFENAHGIAVTVNGERYRDMINNFFGPQLEDLDLRDMWFQQDGATSHIARDTREILKRMFPDKLISKFGDIDWPPRSPDLTPLDFFLWGFLKGKVYTNKPQTIEQLKVNIREDIAAIQVETCENVMQNVLQRARICMVSRGGHLNDIVFHT